MDFEIKHLWLDGVWEHRTFSLLLRTVCQLMELFDCGYVARIVKLNIFGLKDLERFGNKISRRKQN